MVRIVLFFVVFFFVFWSFNNIYNIVSIVSIEIEITKDEKDGIIVNSTNNEIKSE
jgi:hypothetical protein